MATDSSELDTFLAMLRRAGVEYQTTNTNRLDERGTHIATQIDVRGGLSWLNRGYLGFVAEFAFDSNGQLLHIGVYE